MRIYKAAGPQPLELKLRDSGEFQLRSIVGKAGDGNVLEYEGMFDWKGTTLTLNCQFKVETRLVEEDAEEPTAVRHRCRDAFSGALVKDVLTLKWAGRTDTLTQEKEH
jgi:hypothetical protein